MRTLAVGDLERCLVCEAGMSEVTDSACPSLIDALHRAAQSRIWPAINLAKPDIS